MNDQEIFEKAKSRLAEIFNLSVDDIQFEHQFGVHLAPSFVSDFKDNELDYVNDDIHDVADRAILKEMKKGQLIIRTVNDYCNHMVRCYKLKPKKVSVILAKPKPTNG